MSKFINDLRTRATRSLQWRCELCEGRQPVKLTRWVWVARGAMWAIVGGSVYAGVHSMVQPDSGALDTVCPWLGAGLATGLALWLHLIREAEGEPLEAPREAVPETMPVGLNMADRELG